MDEHLIYKPGTTYECVYCGEPFVGNDRYRDIYRCDKHLLLVGLRPLGRPGQASHVEVEAALREIAESGGKSAATLRLLTSFDEGHTAGRNTNPAMIRRYYLPTRKIPDAIRASFPLIQDIVGNATELTGCTFEFRARGFDGAAAHAHRDIGRICIPGLANPSLWNDLYVPTGTLLHEYAHLVTGAGHENEEFWACNRSLHEQFNVNYIHEERIRAALTKLGRG